MFKRFFCKSSRINKHPSKFITIGTPILLGTARLFAVELFLQSLDKSRESYDFNRAFAFGAYGGITCMMAVPLQVIVYAKWISNRPDQKLRPLFAAIFDCTVTLPFTDFPVCYIMISIAKGDEEILKSAFKEWKKFVYSDTVAVSKIWIPANCLNFFLLPPQYRGLCFAAAGYMWSIYFCWKKMVEGKIEDTKPLSLKHDLNVATLLELEHIEIDKSEDL